MEGMGRRPHNPVRRDRKHSKYSDAVMELYQGKCDLCGDLGADTIDHVVPVAWGGADHPSNLVPAHRSCNSRKGADRPGREQYREPSKWLPGYGANVTGMVWLPMFAWVRNPIVVTVFVVALMTGWVGALFGSAFIQDVGAVVAGGLTIAFVITVATWWVTCWRFTRGNRGKIAIRADDWLAYELEKHRAEHGTPENSDEGNANGDTTAGGAAEPQQ